jgi:hypothetical protein
MFIFCVVKFSRVPAAFPAPDIHALLVGTGVVFKRLLPKAFAVLTGGRQRGTAPAPSALYAFFPPPGFLPGAALPAGFAVSLPAALPVLARS